MEKLAVSFNLNSAISDIRLFMLFFYYLAIREAGGAFARLEVAREEEYFHKKVIEFNQLWLLQSPGTKALVPYFLSLIMLIRETKLN